MKSWGRGEDKLEKIKTVPASPLPRVSLLKQFSYDSQTRFDTRLKLHFEKNLEGLKTEMKCLEMPFIHKREFIKRIIQRENH